MMEIISAVPSHVFARQRTLRPSLIKRMGEQIIFGDSRVQLVKEIFGSHRSSVRDQYTGNNPVIATTKKKPATDLRGFQRIKKQKQSLFELICDRSGL